ncbi:universal stress protein [Pseudomonas lalucatii]|uniref:Universal stress protein n=1 Tax=Pseudomonas lalucatii TaxID=1424203 RepID=A0ABS5PV40_9PSED|nr:universal stress protein [Pseudomonas lalucatii]MBS7724659.1 universal stress protein [Pseudomonas lalucatii]
MQTIRNTLVVLDVTQPASQILNRAKLIASATQSHLHLLVCDKHNDHSALLAQTQETLRGEDFSVSAEQAWRGSEHRTIIAAQQQQGCGLVIKQHQRDTRLSKNLILSEDWKLLRYCPAPVLIVRTDSPWQGGHILAAIDAGNSDVDHRVLHAGIVGHAHDIARMTGGALHLMTAHPCAELMAADPLFRVKDNIKALYRSQCRALLAEFAIADDCLHIEEGPADSLIPAVARRLGVALTVIGSVARSGLSGALIGNTAETVLDSLDCDVLVLKPEDIINHLEELAAPPSADLDQAIHSWPYSHAARGQAPGGGQARPSEQDEAPGPAAGPGIPAR